MKQSQTLGTPSWIGLPEPGAHPDTETKAQTSWRVRNKGGSLCALKLNAREDKDVESVSDSPGRTQEPLQTHTFSLKNNAAGLSSDEHENPLNGTQPNPFVYSSVPAVPHAGNSLPSGALVNGPGSHPNSEVHCVLNKGTVLSHSVLDAAWQAEKDMSPEVLPPPSELQSDARKNTVGPHAKTPATQPGVNTPLSHPEQNESKLACSTPAGDSAEQMRGSPPLPKQTIQTRSPRDAERSRGSSDDYDNTEVISWDSTRKCFLHNDRRLEAEATPQRGRKQRAHAESASGCSRLCGRSDAQSVHTGSKDEFLGTQSDIKYSAVPFKDLCGNTALDSESRIYSSARGGGNEENDPEDENCAAPKVEQLKAEQLEQDSLFFSCTICNDNFKEKRHFHRHMMYHLGAHNQVSRVPQPFTCAECRLLFWDSSSLVRHIIIHHERLEEPRKPESEGRAPPVPPPRSRCTFGWNCPKICFQDTETHENRKHYYFCQECSYITSTQRAPGAHSPVAHLHPQQPQHRSVRHTNEAGGARPAQCKMGFFTSRDEVQVEKHSGIYKYTKMADQPRMSSFKPKLFEDQILSCCSSQNWDLYLPQTTDEPARSLQPKARASCSESTLLSPHLWRLDKHGKLLLQPAEKLDVEADLTCVEEDAENNDRKAFGSLELANCPAAAAFTARKLKLEQMFCQGSKNDLVNGSLRVQVSQNSPSMRKMTTPLHNTTERMNGNILPGLSQRPKKQCAVRELKKGCEGDDNFSDDTSEATGGFLESSENERKSYARRYLRKRKSFTAKQNPHTLKVEDDGDEDCSDIEQLVIKEEHIETTVSNESTQLLNTSPSDSLDISSSPSGKHKPCPYCAAMFESGVGLSNHVRGHLHRAGVSYDARHTLSPEQVALWDHQPRIRRRGRTGMRKMKRAVKPGTGGQHTCPLCWECFDTKTGLSNHVRGHLKRAGTSVSSSKSPLCTLNDLLQNKKEHRNTLQVLTKSQIPSRPSASQRFLCSSGPFLAPTCTPAELRHGERSLHPVPKSFVPKRRVGVRVTLSERKRLQVETERASKASSSTLVELLQSKQESVDPAGRRSQEADAPRMTCDTTKDYVEQTETSSLEPVWADGVEPFSPGCGSKQIYIREDDTFPAVARLPGHIQANAHRKRVIVHEEAGCDYEQKKLRQRPRLKKNILPLLNTEICTLTCRFCDLVFQGPLSIQEDWIRHLQRHLLHTSVPHSGRGMVEILGLHHKIKISMSH